MLQTWHVPCPPLAPWLRAGHRREPSGARGRRERGPLAATVATLPAHSRGHRVGSLREAPEGALPNTGGAGRPACPLPLAFAGRASPAIPAPRSLRSLGVAETGPAALGPPPLGVKIDSGGRLCRPPFADPFLALLGQGIGRPDGLPLSSSFASVAALPTLRTRAVRIARFGRFAPYAPECSRRPSPLKGGGRGPLRVLGDGATPPARHRPLGRTFGRDGRFAPCSLMTAAPPAFGRPGWGRAHPQGRRRDGRFAPCAFAPRSPLLDGRCAPVGIVGVAPFVGLAALAASPALEGLRPGVATPVAILVQRISFSLRFVFPP